MNLFDPAGDCQMRRPSREGNRQLMRKSAQRVFDEWLLMAAKSGDVGAGEKLAQRWHPRLLRTAQRLLQDRDRAEEATQEAWVGICRGWHGLSDPAKFPAWAFGILHRKCADRIRLAQRDRRWIDGTAPMPDGEVPARAEDRSAIRQAFDTLDPVHRMTAVLFFGEGLTLAEIAAVTSVPVGTVKSRLFNARQKLKAVLSGEMV